MSTEFAVPGDVMGLGRGLLRASLLLFLAEGPRHGYELAAAVESQGLLLANTSYIYRTMRELEAAGLVASRWEPSERAGPSRRVYLLTVDGDGVLSRCAGAARELAEGLQRFGTAYTAYQAMGERPAPPADPSGAVDAATQRHPRWSGRLMAVPTPIDPANPAHT